MALNLQNANGDPVSLFGSGNSAYAMGQKTNAFESQSDPFDYAEDRTAPGALMSPKTFGAISDVNAAEHTMGLAGSTNSLGFGDLRDVKAPRSPRRGGRRGQTIWHRCRNQADPRRGRRVGPDRAEAR
jgi:hypothetical protein